MANKWWVAINTGSSSTFSGADFFGPPSGYQVFQAGSAADESALEKTPVGGTVTLHNIIWQVGGGPYNTQAEAQAAVATIQKSNPAPGALQQITGINPNVFSSVQNALTGFYDKLTDGKMWRSLGWIILGVLLMFIGISLYLKKTIASTIIPGVA